MPYVLSESAASAAVKAVFAQEDVARVVTALQPRTYDDTVRLVGGAVRDIYLGVLPRDLDFATVLQPEEVQDALELADIRWVDTGDTAFAHGTVVAIVGDRKFEITSLRRDVKTDGRHAKVEFIRDWKEDSNRRDFTIHAFYASVYGTIFDYHGGERSLRAGELRFIGDPEDRLREDTLRAYRYCRMLAQLGWRTHDRRAGEACAKAAHDSWTDDVHPSRIWQELERMLSVEDPRASVYALERAEEWGLLGANDDTGEGVPLRDGWQGYFERYAAAHADLPHALRMEMVEAGLIAPARKEAVARLELLLDGDNALAMAQSLYNLSPDTHGTHGTAKDFKSVVAWNGFCQNLHDANNGLEGKAAVIAGLLAARLHVACAHPGGLPYEEFARAALDWESVTLPIDGKDLLDLGGLDGKRLGIVKADVRTWWLAEDREPRRGCCMRMAAGHQLRKN